jgi:hypothetical protein
LFEKQRTGARISITINKTANGYDFFAEHRTVTTTNHYVTIAYQRVIYKSLIIDSCDKIVNMQIKNYNAVARHTTADHILLMIGPVLLLSRSLSA